MLLVCRCLNGDVSVLGASREAGTSFSTIQRWITKYEAEGIESLQPHSKNRVYRPEEKLRAVQDYLSGKGSLLDICKMHKIKDARQLSKWIKVYKTHGDFYSVKRSGGGSYMKQGRETTQEERIQIVKDCVASGKNYGEMALKYKVSYQQVRTWTLRL